MKKIILLVSMVLAFTAIEAQPWVGTNGSNRFYKGIGIARRDTAGLSGAGDTSLFIQHLDNNFYLKGTGYFLRIATGSYVLVSDTASMLSNLLRKTDTLAMLSKYLRKTDTTFMLSNRLKISDTALMLSNYVRSTGSGFLPLSAGSGNKLTGDLYINKTDASVQFQGNAIDATLRNTGSLLYIYDEATGTKGLQFGLASGALTQLGSGALTWNGAVTGGAASFTTGAFSSTINAIGLINTNGGAYQVGTWDAIKYISGTSLLIGGYNSSQWATLSFYTNATLAMTINSSQDISITQNLRLAYNKSISGRNIGNTADITLIGVFGGVDKVYLDPSAYGVLTGGTIVAGSSVTATSFFESSDLRYKTVLTRETSTDGIDMISFNWNKDLKRDNLLHYGYGAQEVAKILPDAVQTNSDGFKSVNYTEVLVYKISLLEKRISKLENKNK